MNLIVERDVRIPMRDSATLSADIYRPDVSAPVPVVLSRTPYGRTIQPYGRMADGVGLNLAGYAVVVQDCRGCFDSDGTFAPFVDEEADGYDTIEWLATRPWSNGRIGMVGNSYFGATQWLAAMSGHPALIAIAPNITSSDYHEGWTYQGGAFQLGFALYWAYEFAVSAASRLESRAARGERTPTEPGSIPTPDEVIDAIDELERAYLRRPLIDQPILRRLSPYALDDWLGRPSRDGWWRSISPRDRHARIATAAMSTGGWYDIFVNGTIENYVGMRAHAATPAARAGQRLLIGPWTHPTAIGFGDYPDRRYGSRSASGAVGYGPIHQRWFDHWLKGVPTGLDREPPVRIFVMGLDQWRDELDWPLPDTDLRRMFLHGRGNAATGSGDGILSFTGPSGAEPDDLLRSDPADPVPSMGGPTLSRAGTTGWNPGPFDQRSVEARSDVLCYTSEVLLAPLEVTGTVELVVYVASSAVDLDLTAKLVDVWPNGRAEILTDGILRARYRESLADPQLLEPDRVYELRVLIGATSNQFLAGHRIRLELAGSNFPRFDVNTNSGGTIAAEGPDVYVVAATRVFHDVDHPSHLVLPVIDRR